MKFRGKIYKSENTNYFFADPVCCSGFAYDLLKGSNEYHDYAGPYSEFTWGYDGEGSQLTAIAILASAVDPKWNVRDWKSHPQRKRILKLYKAFSAEVVANFGDEWSMTQDEVLDWVKKKEAK